MKTTPFTEKHIMLGAKMHEFAGYNMPIEYSGIIDEHLTVCQSVGVFDVSHMGELVFHVEGVANYALTAPAADVAVEVDVLPRLGTLAVEAMV